MGLESTTISQALKDTDSVIARAMRGLRRVAKSTLPVACSKPSRNEAPDITGLYIIVSFRSAIRLLLAALGGANHGISVRFSTSQLVRAVLYVSGVYPTDLKRVFQAGACVSNLTECPSVDYIGIVGS